MTTNATMPFPARLKTQLKFDPVMMLIATTLLLGGLVILASASITVSDNVAGQPFYYLERQLFAALIGAAAAFVCLLVPMRAWQTLSPAMLLVSIAVLCLVLVPGVGYEVNGASRMDPPRDRGSQSAASCDRVMSAPVPSSQPPRQKRTGQSRESVRLPRIG